MDPNHVCCTEVTKFDFACIYKNFTPNKERYYSVEKVVYVARYCGLKVQSGLNVEIIFFSLNLNELKF
ncbi:hypothetical protein Pint_30939 [Pistacia integerrima]|uniref:Uncharacterized protein n=1 Tax=Pistacia integerrima TaxID=434235 RepID=A0ACC0XRC5_9ROSI|nr:hypothetical protein Pint_30939 [Pistacia integerrima]